MYRNAAFYFLLALLIAVAGFWPSYFAQLPQTDAAHHLHGISATCWMLLLITQAWLQRTRRRRAHRWLGRASILVVIAFAVSGALMMQAMLRSSSPFSQQFGVRLAFLDLTSVLFFVLAYGLAIAQRRNVQLHARWMASTALLVLPPALSRFLGHYVPGVESFDQALYGSYLIVEAAVLVLIAQDCRSGGLRAPYLALLALMLVQHGLVGRVSEAAWWLPIADWIRQA